MPAAHCDTDTCPAPDHLQGPGEHACHDAGPHQHRAGAERLIGTYGLDTSAVTVGSHAEHGHLDRDEPAACAARTGHELPERRMTTQPQAVIAVTPALPNRRNAELLLLGFAAVITAVALLIVEANQEQGVRWDLAQSVLAYLALFGAAHMAIRRYAPYAGPLGCWEYQGARTASVRFDGRRRRIHRVVYELATGEQPASWSSPPSAKTRSASTHRTSRP